MMIDLDGLERYSGTWTIEGRKGTKVRTGQFFEAHEGELENIRAALRLRVRKGDTLTITFE